MVYPTGTTNTKDRSSSYGKVQLQLHHGLHCPLSCRIQVQERDGPVTLYPLPLTVEKDGS